MGRTWKLLAFPAQRWIYLTSIVSDSFLSETRSPHQTHLELKNKRVKRKRASSTPNNSKLLLAIRWKQRKMDMTHSQSLSPPGSNTAVPQRITHYSNTASYKTEHSSRRHRDPVTYSFTETCFKTLSQGTRRNRREMGQSPPELPPKTVLPTAGGLPATSQPQPPSS